MSKILRSLLFSLSCLMMPLAQAAAPVAVQEADYIVAVVGDDVITRNQLRSRLATALRQLERQGTPLPPQEVLERQMLERMIMDKAQFAFAKESGLRIDDQQLDQAIGRIAANNQMSVAQFRSALEKDGVDYAQFRQEIREEMIMVRLREREVESRLVVSDSEIDNYLANQAANGGGGQYRLAHILLRAPESVTPEQLQRLRKRGEDALARARSGENFAELSAAFSDAPDALQGGDIGWRPLDRLPTLYAEAAVKLSEGGVSELLRSSAGFHIVKLLEKRGGSQPASVQQT
ncbi:MAG: peptidylprolyl isomerase, partial [Azonexus sp.]|nr:peptidylprolyl isomerase [Azonexus sp.]